MEFLPLMLLAVSLAMDAFAVAITNGIVVKHASTRDALKTGLFFGVFQGVMPLIGYLLGITVSDYIKAIDHWIAFGLLGFIGVKMIVDTLRSPSECDKEIPINNPFENKNLFLLAIATSIDALAVGLTLALLGANILQAALTIGVVTFALSALGVLLGRLLGCAFQRGAQITGGIVLVLIGVRILVEHLS